LPKDHRRLINNAGLFHFKIKLVSFTRALPYSGKNRHAAVYRRDIVNEFHDYDGFSYSGSAK
jgi:hypothetical protein